MRDATNTMIAGWRRIADHIAVRAGFSVAIDSAIRWSKRELDPLPVRRWGLGRPRVVADADALEAWCDRQWTNPERDHGGR